MLKIGVTGGIGSGKSTLCNMFKELGAPIYDSDNRAKEIMTSSEGLRQELIDAFGADSYVGQELNRAYLAEQVFTNADNLERLNAIVHPRVKKDFFDWCDKQGDVPYVVLECAILFDAEFDKCVDKILCVLAPKAMRIERVISRDALTTEQVENRIANQMSDDKMDSLSDYSVVNFDIEDLEAAAKVFDKKFRYESARH